MGLILLSFAISYIISSYAAKMIHQPPAASGTKPPSGGAPAGTAPKPAPATKPGPKTASYGDSTAGTQSRQELPPNAAPDTDLLPALAGNTTNPSA